jgi:insulysin
MESIVHAECDINSYALFTLHNQLKVMLITNNETDVSAASISIQTGYMQDPDDIPGLTNLLHHMLIQVDTNTGVDQIKMSSEISETDTNYNF